MRIVVSGGGTAGHINPALAVAAELIERGHEVVFAGNPTGIEARLATQAGLEFKPFEAAGFDRAKPTTLVSSSLLIAKSSRAAKRWFKEKRPDAVVGFGGYVELPVGFAAEQMGIPVVVHEQNSVPGVANKALAKKAKAVALTYEHARSHIQAAPGAVVEVTGNPVRPSVLAATREQGRGFLGLDDDVTLLLVFGGSLGARHLNTVLCTLKDELLARPDLRIVHITGPKELDTVNEALALEGDELDRWRVMGYCDHMGEVLAACDMVVSRAGATSLAEIVALGVPALLVPFPYATADHQTMNARALVEAEAAVMVADSDLEEQLRDNMIGLLDDPARRARMREVTLGMRGGDATGRVADLVEAAAGKGE